MKNVEQKIEKKENKKENKKDKDVAIDEDYISDEFEF